MLRIITLNPKGGSGKSTIATNLASYFASRGKITSLLDCDPQGSSNFWLRQRPEDAPTIESLADTPGYMRSTRTWLTTPRRGTQVQIIDTPARPDLVAMGDCLRTADHILIPVLPSEMDMDVARRFVGELLRTVKLPNPERSVGTCANRTRPDCQMSRQLESFLEELPVRHIATFRDSPHYAHACARGQGLFDSDEAFEDQLHWQPLLSWLDPQHTPIMMPAFTSRKAATINVRRRQSRPGARSRMRNAI